MRWKNRKSFVIWNVVKKASCAISQRLRQRKFNLGEKIGNEKNFSLQFSVLQSAFSVLYSQELGKGKKIERRGVPASLETYFLSSLSRISTSASSMSGLVLLGPS